MQVPLQKKICKWSEKVLTGNKNSCRCTSTHGLSACAEGKWKKKKKTLSDALNICKSSSPETAKPVWQQNKQQIGFTRGQCDAFSRLCRLVHCQWSQFSSAPVYCKQTRRRFCQDEGWLTSRRLGAVKHSLWGTCLESGQAQVGVECFRHRKLSMFSVAVLPLNKVVRLLPGSDDCCFTKSVHLAPNGANKAVSVAQIV